MAPDEGSASDLQYALDQLNNAPPPPPSADEPISPTAPPSGTPDPDFEYDGSSRREAHTAHSAARELSFARRRRGQEADGADPRINFVDPLRYQREPEGELTAAQAARDLGDYRIGKLRAAYASWDKLPHSREKVNYQLALHNMLRRHGAKP
jgi:hypothetical protein